MNNISQLQKLMKPFLVIKSFERFPPPLPSQSLLAVSSVLHHASDEVDEMTSLSVFTSSLSDMVSFRYKCYISKQNHEFSVFTSLTSLLLFLGVAFFSPLLVTVKWDKYIPVPNSWPTRSFPVGFCAGVLPLKGSGVLCFSVSCSQTILCVWILVETSLLISKLAVL